MAKPTDELQIIGELPDNTELYRITSFDRIIEMFEASTLTLVSPSRWADPLERFLLESTQSIYTRYAKNPIAIYAQCWSLRARSDALWGIFSPNKDGVRISTTVGNLRAAVGSKESLQIFLGRVDYPPQSIGSAKKHSDKSFEGRASKALKAVRSALGEREVAKLLLLKRQPFDHEKEVRLIAVGNPESEDLLQIPILPHLMIETIQFDPRMTSAMKTAFTRHLQSEAINFEGRFIKSTLYQIPQYLRNYVADAIKPTKKAPHLEKTNLS